MARALASTDNLVLGTVNAPYKRDIDAELLATRVRNGDPTGWLSHLASFFSEVSADLILDFADGHRIDRKALLTAYNEVKKQTGEFNTALESRLVGLE